MSEHTNKHTETHACDSISRQKAINTVKKMRAVCDTDSIEDYEALLETAFEALPSAQPEITRCKDCKWHGYNECFHKLGLIAAFDNNYCSYAEREEE